MTESAGGGSSGGGSYWGALGQVGGAFLDYEAASQRRRQLARLNAFQRDGRQDADRWASADEQDLIDHLRGLTVARYNSQGRLAADLSGPERGQAGDRARTGAHQDIDRALSRVDMSPSASRATVGNTKAFSQWGAASDAKSQPLLDARRRLLTETRAQRGLTRFDTQALDRSANTSIDLSRQAQERQQRSQLLAQWRQKMLAQLGIDYADPGPTRSQQNLGMWADISRVAGAYADSYSASQGQGGGQTGGDYDWFADQRQDRYTYNPYGR